MLRLAFVGAGLARDAGASVYQLHRGDAIAGKPAPTKAGSQIKSGPTQSGSLASRDLQSLSRRGGISLPASFVETT
ncbi:hypothetical protein F7R12_16405 [Pseudomonas tolaasii]|nr:hypothetical protein F7R12_16405 [Pseudomonas tolaasii]